MNSPNHSPTVNTHCVNKTGGGLRVILRLMLFMICCMTMISCSNDNTRDNSSVWIDSDTVLIAEPVDEEPESVPGPVKFSNAMEAVGYMENSQDSSRYMNGILPRMATEELSYVEKLINSDHPYFFIVDKKELELVVFNRYGEEIKRMGICCSKNFGTKHKKRDNRTPEGFFTARGVYNSEEWLFTDDDGNTSDVKGQFGPKFIRLNVPNTTQIGIHGTVAPWSIGHRRSHGCIRVTNENILEIVQYVDSGMPIIVSPGNRDMAVNREEGYYIPSVSTRTGSKRAEPTQLPPGYEVQKDTASVVPEIIVNEERSLPEEPDTITL